MQSLLALVLLIFSLPMAAFGQTPARKTSFSGDLGAVSASGNTRLRTMNVGEKVITSRGRLTLGQAGAYVYGETKSEASANQLRLSSRADYAFRPRVAVFLSGAYERNRIAGFTRRTDENLGLAIKALETPRDSLRIDVGGVLSQIRYVGDSTDSAPAARLGAAYQHTFSKAAYLQQLAEYIPDIESGGKYRVNAETALVAPISAHIGVKLGYVVRYDSHPSAGFGTTDRVLTTGIQVTY